MKKHIYKTASHTFAEHFNLSDIHNLFQEQNGYFMCGRINPWEALYDGNVIFSTTLLHILVLNSLLDLFRTNKNSYIITTSLKLVLVQCQHFCGVKIFTLPK
jgi:hypothetical protein